MRLSRQVIFQEIGKQGATVFLEDSYGFIWIGANGLFRYDGYSILPFNIAQNDSSKVSMGTVNTLFEDSKNRMWVGTSNGLFQYKRDTSESFKHLLKNTQGSNRIGHGILSLLEDSGGRLWIGGRQHLYLMENPDVDEFLTIEGVDLGFGRQGALGFTSIIEASNGDLFATSNKGLWLIKSDFSVELFLPPKWQNTIAEFQILDAAFDDQGFLWLATIDGLWTFNTIEKTFSKKELPAFDSSVLQKILIIKDSEIWVGSVNDGLFRLKNREFTHFPHDSNNPNSLPDNTIRALMIDRFNNLWIGTMAGVSRINFKQQKFPFYQIDPGPYRLNNYVHRVIQDSLGGFWFRLLRLGLGYSPGLGEECEILLEPKANTNIEEIKNFCVDSDGNVWVITLTNGLYKFEKGQKKFSQIDLGDSLKVAYTHDIIADRKDSQFLWFSSRFGLCRVNRFTFERKWFSPKKDLSWMETDLISPFEQSGDGNLWCTLRSKGRNRIGYFDKEKERFVAKPDQPGHPSSVIYYNTRHIKAVPGNKVWVGTPTGLIIIDASDTTFIHLTEKDSLPMKSIESITPDLEGNIWFAGRRKICKYNGVIFECLDAPGDIEGFNASSATLGKDGRITFGGRNGIYSFFPNEINFETETFRPKIYLTNFKVFNEKRHLGKAFELLKEISIHYDENVINFEFSALHFLHSDRIRYRHKLEGFEKNWSETSSNERQATYTNLSPGSYTFKVLATDGNGFWTEENDSLQIKLIVLPPWYRTKWAYLLYVLSIFGLLFGLRYYELRRQLARAEARQLKELDAVKTRLYTNITHEFRTPLTIIQGIAGRLQDQVNYMIRKELNRIQRNSRQLLDLVNQMLDLARLEGGSLPMHMVQGNVIVFIKYLLESFRSLAEAKNIVLHFDSSGEDTLMMDYDPEKLRQIVSNLLSNAIKFTPSDGNVYLVVKHSDIAASPLTPHPSFLLTVTDTGIGIPSEKVAYIFDRFYQADNSTTRKGEGTGIGLTLTKELVKLLGGTIEVESELGKGTVFQVMLPIRQEADILEASVLPIDPKMKEFPIPGSTSPIREVASSSPLTPRPSLLIIEDNQDVVHYLTTLLRGEYHLLTAFNGKDGLKTAQQKMPHLILCDVMMPEMDGYEVCKRLKADMNTSHIPIVLLTAKADFDARIKGLDLGADAYLAKPFEEKELRVRLKKLLENRERLKQFYTSGAFISQSNLFRSEELTLSKRDQEFFQQLLTIVEENLGDPSFTAEKLSDILHLTYSTCLRKVKAVTSMTIKEYIRHIRIHRASQLLIENPERSITSIALDVGFNTNAYFSREFKKVMGCTPSAFRQ